jgi:hypothetical protein
MSYFDQTTIANAAGTVINPAQDETIILLRRIAKLLESSATTDSSQRQRVIAEQATAANLNVTASVTFASAQSVNSTAVASTVNMGQVVVGYGPQAAAAANIIDSRFQLIDIARAAYANGIRAKLT